MKLWVIVCTELHHCIGPVTSKSLATMMAIMMTEQGGDDGCVYVPVPMQFLGIAVEAESIEEVKAFQKAQKQKSNGKDVAYRGGQYL